MRRVAIGCLVTSLATALLGAAPAAATWSIVGVDESTGEVGVAVASCIGSEVTVVPVLVPGAGAAASQAQISPESGDRIVDAMRSGASAQEVIDAIVDADDRPDDRQFGAVVLGDGGAGWSGADNSSVATDRRTTDGLVSAQGNILVDEAVVDDAIAAFEAADGDLADRLLAALLAGADAGGDSRYGEQTATAAALLVATADDPAYAHTDASVFGVDPESTPVPSVFVSVLVERDGDRAPDRLAEQWERVDRDAPSIVIRQVDPGADTDADRLALVAYVVLGVAAVVVIAVVVGIVMTVRRRRRVAKSATASSDVPPSGAPPSR